MSTSTGNLIDSGIASRMLKEGYGPGAWHGPDLKAALDGVTPAMAFWRPAAERHNIAEVALHHAFYVRSVRSQLSGQAPEPFVLEGEDWFPLADGRGIPWKEIAATVESQHQRLDALVAAIEAGTVASPVSERERIDLVIGITCHAVYHAGQVQLLKRLHAA